MNIISALDTIVITSVPPTMVYSWNFHNGLEHSLVYYIRLWYSVYLQGSSHDHISDSHITFTDISVNNHLLIIF